MSQSLELRSDETIRAAALKKLDDKILAINSRELVAAEAKYHKSCYKAHTKSYGHDTKASESETAEGKYQQIEHRAYEMLFDYIRAHLFSQPRVIKLTELTDVVMDNMRALGCENDDIKLHTKKHIRRNLEREFCDSLHFVHAENGRVLVYPDNL